MQPKKTFTLGTLALPLLLGACSDAAGPSTYSQVAVRFGRSASSGASSAVLAPSASRFGPSAQVGSSAAAGEALVVAGSNGALSITNVSFIVAEVELECADDDDGDAAAPACADFEAAPAFVTLPLGTGAVDVASAGVPAGSYGALEFEVENLKSDDDDDDDAKRTQIAALLASVRAMHADFPDEASMVVEGTFTPSGSTEAIPFRTYFDAEIEVELELAPPLAISDAGASRALAVDVQPAFWFMRADGTVLDLSQLDFTRTGALVAFEVEMEQGFRTVELDD